MRTDEKKNENQNENGWKKKKLKKNEIKLRTDEKKMSSE